MMLTNVYCFLIPNILWDILSVYSLSTSEYTKSRWSTQITSFYCSIWKFKTDNNRSSRIVMAYFRAILCLMRIVALIDIRLAIVAATAYGWETFWVTTGVLCGVMRVRHLVHTVLFCGMGAAILITCAT